MTQSPFLHSFFVISLQLCAGWYNCHSRSIWLW